MCMNRELENRLYEAFVSSSGVSTDSRSIDSGAMFFALRGDNFDGNRFAQPALDKGAAYAVVSRDSGFADGGRFIVVDDTLEALQALARMHRSRFRIPAHYGADGDCGGGDGSQSSRGDSRVGFDRASGLRTYNQCRQGAYRGLRLV